MDLQRLLFDFISIFSINISLAEINVDKINLNHNDSIFIEVTIFFLFFDMVFITLYSLLQNFSLGEGFQPLKMVRA